MGFLGNVFKRDAQPVQQSNLMTTDYVPVRGTDGKIMTIGAVYAAVELISNSIAALPILKTEVDGSVNEYFIDDLLKDDPMTKFMVIKCVVRDAILYGKGYIYIERDDNKQPKKLIYCPEPTVVENYQDVGRRLWYSCSILNRPKIDWRDMICFYLDSWDGINGVSIKRFGRNTFDLAKFTEEAAKNYWGSGMDVMGVLTVQGAASQDEITKLRNNWRNIHSGPTSSKLAVLKGNMKYESIGKSSADSQMVESRAFNVQEVARFFGISPLLLGDLSHSQYNSIEQAQLQFVVNTLLPYISMFEAEFEKKLCNNGEKINFDESYLLRTDKNTIARYVTTLGSKGFMSINEGRKMVNLPEVEGGDKLLIPFTDIESNTVAEVK